MERLRRSARGGSACFPGCMHTSCGCHAVLCRGCCSMSWRCCSWYVAAAAIMIVRQGVSGACALDKVLASVCSEYAVFAGVCLLQLRRLCGLLHCWCLSKTCPLDCEGGCGASLFFSFRPVLNAFLSAHQVVVECGRVPYLHMSRVPQHVWLLPSMQMFVQACKEWYESCKLAEATHAIVPL